MQRIQAIATVKRKHILLNICGITNKQYSRPPKTVSTGSMQNEMVKFLLKGGLVYSFSFFGSNWRDIKKITRHIK